MKLGTPLLRFDNLSSTNDVARELAAQGASEGTCIIAREQTAGRGRHGRSWSSSEGGLYLSLVLKPQIKAAESAIITLAAAVAVAETLELDFGARADIKWPNDVLASSRKICGILVESAVEGERLQYAVMGIGVNLSQERLPNDLANTATSMLIETGRRIAPEEFAACLLDRLERWYRVSIAEPAQVIDRFEQLSSYARGCRVQIESSGGLIEGVTRGLSTTGALILELSGGAITEIVSGEVRLRRVRSAKSEVRSPKSEVRSPTG
jgi:BirA family biotin operon repressor/biotin-[acetyl-CoA-carboxylase] ligase